MPKYITAIEKLLIWVKNKTDNEEDKYYAGMKSHYFEWRDLYNDLLSRYGK